MKAMIVLLAIAVAFTYGASNVNLKSIISKLQCLHHETLKTEAFESVYVIDLKKNTTDRCEAEFFCQVEKVLSGVKLLKEARCHDLLLRNLRQYHNGANCSVPTNGDEILLRSFLDNLTKHAKKVFHQAKPNKSCSAL